MKFAVGLTLLGAALLAFSAFNLEQKPAEDVQMLNLFQTWMKEYKVKYSSPAELKYRLSVFIQTHKKIVKENASQNSYELGHNQFSDLTSEEFLAKYTGLNFNKLAERNEEAPVQGLSQQPPASIDWRALGAVTPVQNQQQCGSCWAFSAVAGVEGTWKISGNTLTKFSEQQLVDCSSAYGNQGCNGGLMDNAFKYLIAVKGIELETDYPYTAKNGVCKFSASKIAGTIKSYADVPKNNCAALLTSAANQPVSVAIAANAIQSYKSGVFAVTTCGTQLDHGVTLVGYGNDPTSNVPFYLVKNSWGTSWGEQGYIRMSRNVQTSTGICGICMAASTPSSK